MGASGAEVDFRARRVDLAQGCHRQVAGRDIYVLPQWRLAAVALHFYLVSSDTAALGMLTGWPRIVASAAATRIPVRCSGAPKPGLLAEAPTLWRPFPLLVFGRRPPA